MNSRHFPQLEEIIIESHIVTLMNITGAVYRPQYKRLRVPMLLL